MSEIDDLLSELKQEYQTGQTPNQPLPPSKSNTQSSPAPDSINQLLNEIKIEISQPPKSVAEPKQARKEAPKPDVDLSKNLHVVTPPENDEDREKRRRAALKQKARRWLEKLNPDSDEGRWFEEFSYSYESRLEAAMTYLEALKELDR